MHVVFLTLRNAITLHIPTAKDSEQYVIQDTWRTG